MTKCFACDRIIVSGKRLVRCIDEQTVFVGPDCFKRIHKSGSNGYQPPLGGPKLFVVSDSQLEAADD